MQSTAHPAMPPVVAGATAASRLLSLDAYRGAIMLAMASGGFGLAEVARHFPESAVWQNIRYQFDHVQWVGCALWDMIQPSFMFMVGVSMAFSYAARQARGQSYGRMLLHAVKRSVVLILLGIFLRSLHSPQTNFTFEDVLTQIGLGYTFLFLLWGRGTLVQLGAAALILVGYWYYFYQYPLPPSDFDYASVGVDPEWRAQFGLNGLAAHWNKNTNAAAYFDQRFLNLFSRPREFVFNGGGYLTLSFLPSLATMIFGLVSGELLRSELRSAQKIAILVVAGLVGLGAGYYLDWAGICPIVKRIWTPSWTLFSTGWTCLALAAFYTVVDVWNFRRWTFPLVVVGANSIVMYCMAETLPGWVQENLRIHFGRHIFDVFGTQYEPLVASVSVLLLMWLVCWWLYRNKVFVRI